MGVDFITTCAHSFEKSWDKNRRELSQPNLLTQIPAGERRTFMAVPKPGRVLKSGRHYHVEIVDGKAVLYDGIDIVAACDNLPKSQIRIILENPGRTAVAFAHSIFPASGAADVTIT